MGLQRQALVSVGAWLLVTQPLRRFLEREVAVGSVCKVGTQDPENLDEELKPLVTAWPYSGPPDPGLGDRIVGPPSLPSSRPRDREIQIRR